jgi:hypothetical protein
MIGLFIVGQTYATAPAITAGKTAGSNPTDSVDNAVVRVEINNSSYTFVTKPRVADVLAPVALQQNWYWPASTLYRLNSSGPQQQRQAVIQQLEALQRKAEPALQQEFAALQSQISSWQLAERILISVDYDLARAQPPFNPQFEPGAYKLQLVARPEQVQFWGAVVRPIAVAHSGVTAIASYLPAVERSAFADKSVVYVIQPDGSITEVGVAGWNHQHIEAMPGAQVFIPFAVGWFGKDIDTLNQNLLELALHRVVAQ